MAQKVLEYRNKLQGARPPAPPRAAPPPATFHVACSRFCARVASPQRQGTPCGAARASPTGAP
jgi:hypothetical protein